MPPGSREGREYGLNTSKNGANNLPGTRDGELGTKTSSSKGERRIPSNSGAEMKS